jgi:uncharacterized RDD family membrane protein YckC
MSYAGVWIRFVAAVADSLVFICAGFVVGLLGGMNAGTGAGQSTPENLVGTSVLVWVVIGFLYNVVMETAAGGTVGKQLAGLRVVNEAGNRITLGQSFVRNLLRIVDGLVVYLVGAVFIWSSEKRQRLGDRAAATFVVRAASLHNRARPQGSPTSIPTLPAATRATHAPVGTAVWDEFRD